MGRGRVGEGKGRDKLRVRGTGEEGELTLERRS